MGGATVNGNWKMAAATARDVDFPPARAWRLALSEDGAPEWGRQAEEWNGWRRAPLNPFRKYQPVEGSGAGEEGGGTGDPGDCIPGVRPVVYCAVRLSRDGFRAGE